MKTKELLLIRHFLEILKNRSEKEQLSPISRSMKLLTKKQLISIIDNMFDGQGEDEYPDLKTKSKKDLLEVIDDEYYILDDLINKIEKKTGI